jgi:CubicO group peptidase (beta-lactamase class C family)
MKTNYQNRLWVAQVLFIATLVNEAKTETALAAVPTNTANQSETERLRDIRQQFQLQELIPATANTWTFNPGNPPRIVWRDVERVEQLGLHDKLRVRWFNTRLEEAPVPSEPGRWAAWIEATAPNGLPLRRAMTFYARPKDFLLYVAPELTVSLPYCPGASAPEVWHEHNAELSRLSANLLIRAINDSEASAILLAGLAEAKPLGRPARYVESVDVLNEDFHLALKLKMQGLLDKVRPLRPARPRTHPATVLHEGALIEVGARDDAKATIDDVCHAWAEDTGEPFVTVVARRGVIVTHQAFGKDKSGRPIGDDYRCWVGSITKSVTALLFGQFLDQELIDLDESLATVFPDYPKNDPHVPTFRQCFNHTSGLSGHGDFGGVRNPHLENVFLNAIDVNEPSKRYSYSGNGYELAAKAMENVAGKSFMRLYDDHLFRPLKFGDVPMGNASSDGQFTAMELAIFAQLIANRGSYGDREFISPRIFDRLLPESLHVPDRGSVESEGIGLHWIRHLKTSAPPNSNHDEDQLFSAQTVGHGSLSGCIFIVDLNRQIVITQARRHTGPRYGEWSARFLQAIADVMDSDAQTPPIAVSTSTAN